MRAVAFTLALVAARFAVAVAQCAAGTECRDKSSSSCSNTTTDCMPCARGKFKTTIGADECKDCTQGFLCDASEMGGAGGSPVPCAAGTYDDVGGLGSSSGDTCKTCDAGTRSVNTTVSGGGATSCADCPAGFYAAARSGQGGGALGTSHRCTYCSRAEGQFQHQPKQGTCETCAVGKRIVRGLSETDDASTRCVDCAAGRFQPNRSDSSMQGNGWAKWRQSCATYVASMLPVKIQFCLGEQYGSVAESGAAIDFARGTCYDCPEGRWQSALGATFCTDCPAGQFHNATGATAEAECDAAKCLMGYWCDNANGYLQVNIGGAGFQFDSSFYGPYNRLIQPRLQECPKGRYGDAPGLGSQSQCKNCSSGKYGLDNDPFKTSNAQCRLCGVGRYNSNAGVVHAFEKKFDPTYDNTLCSSRCPAGKWSAQTGLSTAAQCKGDCSAGKYATGTGYSSDAECLGRCTLGQYANKSGMNSSAACTACDEGKYTDALLRTVCSDCPTARYVNVTGATVCESCHRGEYAIAEGNTACAICAPGKYSTDRDIRVFCLECFGGRWSNFSGASALSDCTRLQCPVFPPQERMTVTYTNNRTLPSKAILHMEHGYEESFEARVLCVWSGIPPDSVSWGGLDKHGRLPVARGVQCDVLSAPRNGQVNYTNDRRFPSIAEFRCERGFLLTLKSGAMVDGSILNIECTRDRTWSAPVPTCSRVSCPQVNALLAQANESKAQVQIKPLLGQDNVPPTNWNEENQTADWAYTDSILFACKEAGSNPKPHGSSLCTKDGVWAPDPSVVECQATPCQEVSAPPGVNAMPSGMQLWAEHEGERSVYKNWIPFSATTLLDFECTAHSDLYVRNNKSTARCRSCISDGRPQPDGKWQQAVAEGVTVCCSIHVACTPTSPTGADSNHGELAQLTLPNTNPDVPADPYYRNLECRCAQGFINVEDTRRGKCVPCSDGTYAPLLHGVRRVECRACPFEGVSCMDGVLRIKEDWWYDVKRYDALPALERGLGSQTEFYKCPHRAACIVATDVVPQTMYCTENHTGVMCSVCYHRHRECGRGGRGRDDACAPPRYLDRGRSGCTLH